MMSKIRNLLDKGIGRLVSKKLLVWLVATIAFFLGLLPSSDWFAVCLMYIGMEGAADIVSRRVAQNLPILAPLVKDEDHFETKDG